MAVALAADAGGVALLGADGGAGLAASGTVRCVEAAGRADSASGAALGTSASSAPTSGMEVDIDSGDGRFGLLRCDGVGTGERGGTPVSSAASPAEVEWRPRRFKLAPGSVRCTTSSSDTAGGASSGSPGFSVDARWRAASSALARAERRVAGGADGRADLERVWYGLTTAEGADAAGAAGAAGVGETGAIVSSTWRIVEAARAARADRRTGCSNSSGTPRPGDTSARLRSTASTLRSASTLSSLSASARRFDRVSASAGIDVDADRGDAYTTGAMAAAVGVACVLRRFSWSSRARIGVRGAGIDASDCDVASGERNGEYVLRVVVPGPK